jgi:phosphoglycerol transferase MdoB-like AlkP superfamily enzyme
MRKIIQFLKGNYYLVFLYRLFLIYLLFSLSRIEFLIFTHSHFQGLTAKQILRMLYGGLLFDTSALAYINMLYICLFFIPFKFRYKKNYQLVLLFIFIITNGIALLINSADIGYFDFVLQRSTVDIFTEFKHEHNLIALFGKFIIDWWYLTLIWIIMMAGFIWAYRKVKIEAPKLRSAMIFYPGSILMLAVISGLLIAGARGGFRHSTRPIVMSNAGAYVKNNDEMAIVLNTPFTLMHSFEIRGYKRVKYFSDDEKLNSVYSPIHMPAIRETRKENVVIFIVESLNKEFLASLTNDLDGGNYKGYTPFLDSLVGISKTYLHSYANGRKSIDALPSVLTSIPRVEMPFILTPYYNNKLNSLPGLLKEKGYKSAFFHGAPNGSMGFLAFTNLIGVDEYYGKTEYNNDKDFDGIWGIWDEDFMQFFAHTIDTFSKPFIATLFTVSSHHPFTIPQRYAGKFKKDNFVMSECVQYTDYAFRRFFETASKMTWFRNTLFIITADHVSLNQREEFQNDIGYFSVPVIFYKPGSNLTGLDRTINAQQIDIMPTVLNYLGYDQEYLAFGKDLFDLKSPNVAINYLNDTYRLFMDDYLLIHDGKQSKGFYHVDTYRKMSADISLQNPRKKEEMENYLKAFIQQYVNRMIDNKLTVR